MPCPHVSGHFLKRRFFSLFSKKYAYTRSIFEPFSSVFLKRISQHFQKTPLWVHFLKTCVFCCPKRPFTGGRRVKTKKKNLRFEKYPVTCLETEYWRAKMFAKFEDVIKSSSFSILFVAKVPAQL